ncbi:hypothetical protein C8R45DRAFT_1011511 [Mycena sanguinolenta]|nr:hypothetical protein C8R45DRAFT_1011511 [Mycena sanguinolenta]
MIALLLGVPLLQLLRLLLLLMMIKMRCSLLLMLMVRRRRHRVRLLLLERLPEVRLLMLPHQPRVRRPRRSSRRARSRCLRTDNRRRNAVAHPRAAGARAPTAAGGHRRHGGRALARRGRSSWSAAPARGRAGRARQIRCDEVLISRGRTRRGASRARYRAP